MSIPWPAQLVWMALLFFVGIPYGLGPLLIYFTLRLRMPPEVVPFDPRESPLPEGIRPHFHAAHEQLTRHTFELVGTMILPSLMPNVKSILALYVNRTVGDMAMTTFIVATNNLTELKTSYVEFVTRYSDESVVQTNNSRELSSFPSRPDEQTFQFWDIADIARLYGVHRQIVERFGGAARPIIPLDTEYRGDAVAYVGQGVLERTFERQLDTGYLRRVPEGFAPTIKGAVLMTWKELWPWKALRRKQRKTRSQAAARDALPWS